MQGANGIETDVQATKDGVLVLFHDDTLERVTDSTGKIADYTWEELQKVKVYGNSFRGFYDRIPTFRAFLEAFAEYDIHFAIELKEAGIREIKVIENGVGMEQKIDFSVLDEAILKFGSEEKSLIAILQQAQESYRYLPEEIFPAQLKTQGAERIFLFRSELEWSYL